MNTISPGAAKIEVGQHFDYLVPQIRSQNQYYKSGGQNLSQ